jgi:hypothetical protein
MIAVFEKDWGETDSGKKDAKKEKKAEKAEKSEKKGGHENRAVAAAS